MWKPRWSKNQTILLEGLDLLSTKQGLYRELKFYQCVTKCCSTYKHPPKFWVTCKFHSLPWIFQSIILGHLLVKWWFQAPLLDIKICLRYHIYATCVIFGHRGCCLSCKGNVVLLQGNCVHMSSCHHIDMFQTHFMHSCHEGCCIKKSMSYVFWMVYVVSLSVHVRSQSSPINVYICSTDLTLRHFPEQPSLIQLPGTMRFASATIKLPPLPVETPQCTETPSSPTYWNPIAWRDPNQHCSPKMCRAVKQPTLLSWNA